MKIQYSEVELVHKSSKGSRFHASNGERMYREGDTLHIHAKNTYWTVPWTGVKSAFPIAKPKAERTPKQETKAGG